MIDRHRPGEAGAVILDSERDPASIVAEDNRRDRPATL